MKAAISTTQEEEKRLEALFALKILDTEPEVAFDNLVELASVLFDVPMSTVTLVDKNRQWFKSKKGINVSETDKKLAFCTRVVSDNSLLVVQDATKDTYFQNNTLVKNAPYVRFYAGVPLLSPNGYPIGSFSILNTKPGKLNPQQTALLQMLAHQAESLLALRMLQNEVNEMMDMQRKMMSVMSHDLRSPLASLRTLISLFGRTTLDPEKVKSLMVDIESRLESTEFLVSNMLEWGLSSLLRKKLTISKFNPFYLVSETLSAYQSKFNEKNITVTTKLKESIEIESDKNLLGFIFKNLISNALKFTENGTLEISYRKTENKHVFTFKDTGIGIPNESLQNLFEWSSRKSQNGTKNEGGSGIGLIAAKEFAEKLQGTLSVKSKPNKGTSVIIELPFQVN